MIEPTSPPPTPEELAAAAELLDRWLDAQLEENPSVVAVDRDDSDGQRRWLVRMAGEEKATSSVWFHLRQRNLHVESYVMPAPEEDHARFYEHLLRRNLNLGGLRFAIGAEDAVFLLGETPVQRLDEAEADRLLGSMYAAVEQCFRPALRIGFASRLVD